MPRCCTSRYKGSTFAKNFGTAQLDSMFLLCSISKPISVTALMTLFDRNIFKLSDPLQKFIPEFKGDRRAESGSSTCSRTRRDCRIS
jgi:CubicO group peptidase (beta-lactamase class C family)